MMYTEIEGFEWDDAKARGNALKHGVSFVEALDAFQDPAGISIDDVAHSQVERRQWWVGQLVDGRFLVVIYTVRPGTVNRIISARPAGRKERKLYEEAKRKY